MFRTTLYIVAGRYARVGRLLRLLQLPLRRHLYLNILLLVLDGATAATPRLLRNSLRPILRLLLFLLLLGEVGHPLLSIGAVEADMVADAAEDDEADDHGADDDRNLENGVTLFFTLVGCY